MEPFETIEHAGCTIELYQDEDPMSPASWDNLGTMYPLSRDASYRGFAEISETHGQAIEAMERRGVAGLLRYLSLCHGVYAVAFDIFDHSGTSLSAASPKDDHCSGYIATTDERLTALCGEGAEYHSREWAEQALRGELETWSSYFAGEVFGFVVKAAGETVDSCWGFYPDEGTLYEGASAEYVAFWNELPPHLRPCACAIHEAREVAEHEQRERARAASQDIATV